MGLKSQMSGNYCPNCLSKDVVFFLSGTVVSKETWLCHKCGTVFDVVRLPSRKGMAALEKNESENGEKG